MPSADLGPKSHSDEDGDLAEQPPGATSRAAWHPDDTGQPPVWPRDISFHQPGLPGHANHAPRPPEVATPDARHPDDLHHHPQTLGDLAQDSSSLCLWPYEPSTVNIPKLLPGQHVHGALLELQHQLAQANHYALDDPDLPGHDAHPPPLPGAQPRPPPHPGEGERLLLCLWSVPGSAGNVVLGVSARWLCLWWRHFLQLVTPCQPLSAAIGQYSPGPADGKFKIDFYPQNTWRSQDEKTSELKQDAF